MHTYIIHTTLQLCVTPTRFGPQRAIFRDYDWYIFTARSTKCVPDVKFNLLSSLYVLWYAAATCSYT